MQSKVPFPSDVNIPYMLLINNQFFRVVWKDTTGREKSVRHAIATADLTSALKRASAW